MMRQTLAIAAILVAAGCAQKPAETAGGRYYATSDGRVELQFPAGWKEEKGNHPFDLQCMSSDESMTTGVFLFAKEDLAEDVKAQELLKMQVDDLKSKRKNFQLLEEEQKLQLADKTLTTVVYSGEKGPSKYYYRFTLIEFAGNPDWKAVVLQVAFPSQWTEHKPILDAITKSARLRSEKTQPKQPSA